MKSGYKIRLMAVGERGSQSNGLEQGAVAAPASGQELVALLSKKSPKNLSDPNSLKEQPFDLV